MDVLAQIGQKPELTILRETVRRRAGAHLLANGLPPFLFSTRVTVGEHSICSRKGKGGYGIRPYDVDVAFKNEAAGAHLQANAPPPYVMKLISPLRMQSRVGAFFCILIEFKQDKDTPLLNFPFC